MKQKENKMEIEAIPGEVEGEIRGMVQKVVGEMKSRQEEYMSLFKEFFAKQGFTDPGSLKECFTIEDVKPKVFKSKVAEKGDYYSNFLMLLYGQNKKTLFQKLSLA